MDRLKILIVEDELLIAQNLSRKLDKLGYQVLKIVSSGQDALKTAKAQNPDLVLMDIVIKGEMDGIETADQLYRELGLPVIYLTAYADDATLQRAENTGSYGYILKPFNERELHASIKLAIKKHQQEHDIIKTLEVAEQLSQRLQSVIKKTTCQLGGSEQLTLANDLEHAIENQELQVYYQPFVDLKTRQIVGAEALLRWQHTKQGLISPTTFIPIAEETGLIKPIGEWVLREACKQAKQWQSQYTFPFKISVNLSVRQFEQKELSFQVTQILQETELSPQDLDLELTETLMINETVSIVRIIHELKALGLKLAIDDFGTGYSSLSYLQRFPFDIVKVDRFFVQNITQNPDKVAITQAIIQMAHSLNLAVIAEGVETEAEIDFLEQHHCDLVQGYLFSPPVTAANFEKLLEMDKAKGNALVNQ